MACSILLGETLTCSLAATRSCLTTCSACRVLRWRHCRTSWCLCRAPTILRPRSRHVSTSSHTCRLLNHAESVLGSTHAAHASKCAQPAGSDAMRWTAWASCRLAPAVKHLIACCLPRCLEAAQQKQSSVPAGAAGAIAGGWQPARRQQDLPAGCRAVHSRAVQGCRAPGHAGQHLRPAGCPDFAANERGVLDALCTLSTGPLWHTL